jgi:hypothetical protein
VAAAVIQFRDSIPRLGAPALRPVLLPASQHLLVANQKLESFGFALLSDSAGVRPCEPAVVLLPPRP